MNVNPELHRFGDRRPVLADVPPRTTGTEEVDALVRHLLTSLESLTQDLPPSRVEQLRAAAEMLAVTALHAQRASVDALAAVERSSRPFELDALTGLPNRILFRDRFTQAVAHARRRGTGVAVLFVDLDRFKGINDTYGHAVGDEVIRHAARCLRAAGRDVDTVCRHGGDEFLVLLSDVSSAGGAAMFAAKVLALLTEPLRIGNEVLQIGATIGVSLFPDDGDDQDELIRKADAAMYAAKRKGEPYVFASAAATRGDHPVTLPGLVATASPIDLLETTLEESRAALANLAAENDRLTRQVQQSADDVRRAESAAKHQAELLNVVAHELRNSLAPLQSAADVLTLVRSDPASLTRLELILKRQVTHISRVLTDLLEASRLNNGRVAIESERVDLIPLTIDIAARLDGVLTARQQHLVTVHDVPVANVLGDATRLEQLLVTMIEGASAMARTGERMRLMVSRAESMIHLDLLNAAAEPHLGRHESFLQHDVSDTSAIFGTEDGLGLSLLVVSQLAKSHGGSFRVARDPESTAWRFRLALPGLDGPAAH